MEYRKISADQIFDGYRFLKEKALLIKPDGTIEAIIPIEEAGAVENQKGILSPGFVNCHCHLELSHMKGRIPEKTGLVDFVFKVVSERHNREEDILDAIAKAEDEMLQNGIVAVGDICNNTNTLAQKKKERIAYYNFIEASGWLPSLAPIRFERAREIYEAYETFEWSNPHGVSIVPHAPYSVSAELWQKIRPWFEKRTVSIHNQETEFEDEFFKKGTGDFQRMYQMMNIDNKHHVPTGKSSLQSYFDQLKNADRIILVHNSFTTKSDLDYINNHISGKTPWPPTYLCLCANANLYIEDTLPPIDLFLQNKGNMVLGTDSLASNWSLSIADEMKTIKRSFPWIDREQLLKWATSNGARALGLDAVFGSFEKGKKPGILLLTEDLQLVRRLA